MKILRLGLITIISSFLVFGLTGCGEEDSYSEPSVSFEVTSMDIENSGATITWGVSIENEQPDTTIIIGPKNDSTYLYTALFTSYAYQIKLDCNVEGQADCNDVTEIVCDRTLIGSDYSEYSCNYKVGRVIYPQYKEDMRIPVMSNYTPSEEVLMNIQLRYTFDGEDGSEEIEYLHNRDESKMFNMATNNPLAY